MERAAGAPPVDELDAADLDDAMAQLRLEPGGFGVEDDLPHAPRRPAQPRTGRAQRRDDRRAAARRRGTDASAG